MCRGIQFGLQYFVAGGWIEKIPNMIEQNKGIGITKALETEKEESFHTHHVFLCMIHDGWRQRPDCVLFPDDVYKARERFSLFWDRVLPRFCSHSRRG